MTQMVDMLEMLLVYDLERPSAETMLRHRHGRLQQPSKRLPLTESIAAYLNFAPV